MYRNILFAGFVLVCTAAATPLTQQHEHHPQSDETAEAAGHQMMQMHQTMMANMQAMDAELDELMSAMNTATGEAKVEAMAEVISLLAGQRSAMQERMMQMHGEMQSHMAMCPMMNSMSSTDSQGMEHGAHGEDHDHDDADADADDHSSHR